VEIHSAPRSGHARSARTTETKLATRFTVSLPLGYYVSSGGTCGTGATLRISRTAVEFVPADRSITVGDDLQYVLVFPGSAGRAGAVASCRGHVTWAGAAVVVTIDQYHLQPATAVKAAGRDAWKGWLVALCEAARLGNRTATRHAAGCGISAASPV